MRGFNKSRVDWTPLKIVRSTVIDLPGPLKISYMWNFGSLLGLFYIIQIASGILLAMTYVPSRELAFDRIKLILRDVTGGWVTNFFHVRGASAIFCFMYAHVGRGLYYRSYRMVGS